MNENPRVYWPYNETFGFFHDVPLAGKRAFDFVDRRNRCKGGHWVLKTPEEYTEWYRKKGQFLDQMKFDKWMDQPAKPEQYVEPPAFTPPGFFDVGHVYSVYIPKRTDQ